MIYTILIATTQFTQFISFRLKYRNKQIVFQIVFFLSPVFHRKLKTFYGEYSPRTTFVLRPVDERWKFQSDIFIYNDTRLQKQFNWSDEQNYK